MIRWTFIDCLRLVLLFLAFLALVVILPTSLHAQTMSPELKATFCAEVDRAEAWDRSRRLAARTWVESAGDPNAVSPTGAKGWSQFMPPTWREQSCKTNPSCAGVPATDPACSIRTQIVYTRQTRRWAAVSSLTQQDLEAKADAIYNGGVGNLWKEEQACARRAGCDKRRWWGHVEDVCLRHPAACRENRAYPVKINRVLRNQRLMARLPQCESGGGT